MLGILYPSFRLNTVLDLTVERLRLLEVELLLLDVDCTLKNFKRQTVLPEIACWIQEIQAAGIQVCLLSNGREKRIAPLAKQLNLPYEAMACKPTRKGIRNVLKRFNNVERSKILMVGDQIFSDILMGNRAAIRTVLVDPIQPEEEPLMSSWKRPFEKIIFFLYGRKEREKPPWG